MSKALHELKNKKYYLPISEASAFLGVSIDTIRRWDNSGKLTSKSLDGKNRYFAITDLERLKNSGLVSISEASKILHLSISTLRRLEKRGQLLPSRNEHGERVYSQDALNSFVYFPKKQDAKINTSDLDNSIESGSFIGGIKFPRIFDKSSNDRNTGLEKPSTSNFKRRSLLDYKKHILIASTNLQRSTKTQLLVMDALF